ncbi:CLUMA_CG017781, isoform A [Clunio marinus]|uniref:CLUMA_CG017781, isoform A n=1 Tax=Clunio marinus TaxID=568069 RepID=A0A1J1J1I7_9DIPT|nr:CLUMA_CG017781, isoform A [Clunio marinus]
MENKKKGKRALEESEIIPSKKRIRVESSNSKSEQNYWEIHELVAEIEEIDVNLSQTIIQLFEDDFTIPFLCRYRKDLISNFSPEKLRDIKETIENVKLIKTKSANTLKMLEKEKILTEEISRSLRAAKSLDELEHLILLHKPASKGSLYERAEKLGLKPAAENILFGNKEVNLNYFINESVKGLKDLQEVEESVNNVMSHLIAKNEAVMSEVRQLRTKFDVTIITAKLKQKKTEEKKSKTDKFENYYNFSCPAKRIRSHQILAINRGVSLKELSIKYEVDDRLYRQLKHFASQIFLKQGRFSEYRNKIFMTAFDDAYRKKISPFIVRQTQTELSRQAEKASVEVFASNLKNLLLTNPVKGKKILGIDPGFTSGCKLALISETGEVLESSLKFHLNDKTKSENLISSLMKRNNCSLIAIGNATACRETENFIAKLIEKDLKYVQYCIVSEQGASIYSCSDIAKKEFPKIDVSYIGAISIARRLLDPLCELVKIEPKHLGVGMYQHDVKEKTLKKTLDEVISECVSFVGVDLNVASFSLLKNVAGLTEKRAEAIIKYRESNGCFKSRSDLMKVKSIGQKLFTQCAGFVRINALSVGIKNVNTLDSTNVHPESYEIAERIIKDCGLKLDDVGKPKFVSLITKYRQESSLEKLSKTYNENIERINTTFDALSKELLHDYRNEIKIEPVFKKGITDISTLKGGQILSGVVMNVTDFGAFVDLGVGKNGLIHSSAMKGAKLKVSDRIECKVLQIDAAKGRIGLEFVENIF